MNRQQRRAQEREKAKSATRTNLVDRHIDGAGIQPEPGPVGTYLSKYKYGGKTWISLQFEQPNSTTTVLFAPEDARRFADDVGKLVDGVELTEEDVAEPSVTTETGLVVARTMPGEGK